MGQLKVGERLSPDLTTIKQNPYAKYYLILTIAVAIITAAGLLTAHFGFGITPAELFSHKITQITFGATLGIFYIILPGLYKLYQIKRSTTPTDLPAPPGSVTSAAASQPPPKVALDLGPPPTNLSTLSEMTPTEFGHAAAEMGLPQNCYALFKNKDGKGEILAAYLVPGRNSHDCQLYVKVARLPNGKISIPVWRGQATEPTDIIYDYFEISDATIAAHREKEKTRIAAAAAPPPPPAPPPAPEPEPEVTTEQARAKAEKEIQELCEKDDNFDKIDALMRQHGFTDATFFRGFQIVSHFIDYGCLNDLRKFISKYPDHHIAHWHISLLRYREFKNKKEVFELLKSIVLSKPLEDNLYHISTCGMLDIAEIMSYDPRVNAMVLFRDKPLICHAADHGYPEVVRLYREKYKGNGPIVVGEIVFDEHLKPEVREATLKALEGLDYSVA